MGFAILDADGNATDWSRWDNPPRPLEAGETCVPADSLDAVKSAGQRVAEQIADIKKQAMIAILAIAPEWKQRNMMARSLELERKDRKQGLTAEEQAEIDAMESVWAQVKAIRTQSDADEAALLG